MSAAKTMSISLRRKRGALFEAVNASGQTCLIDGPPDLGGQGEGLRPMEALLAALAGCSAMDVVHILEKQQREPLEDLDVEVVGKRAGAVPAVYTGIELRFAASGAVDPHKLERAVRLSMEKYCSVAKMLQPSVSITWSVSLKG